MATGVSWQAFAAAAPDIAAVGTSLLYRPDAGEVGILATVDGHGRPRVAPVCPIFSGEGVYLSVGAHTPKVRDLTTNGRYALHALVGADDLEFQIGGTARLVQEPTERAAVVAAIPFPSFDADDPIFELLIERALVVTWQKPATRGRRQSWRATD
ncbi:MAG: pyridoxamine 5'-phosphate oxidase family protein [Pseudomonadales bacterium]